MDFHKVDWSKMEWRTVRPEPIAIEVGPPIYSGAEGSGEFPAAFATRPLDPGTRRAAPVDSSGTRDGSLSVGRGRLTPRAVLAYVCVRGPVGSVSGRRRVNPKHEKRRRRKRNVCACVSGA